MSTAKVLRFPAARQWTAAKFSAQHADWNVYSRPIDVDIRFGLATLRARARELAQNSDHAKGFLRIVRNNIVGAPGFQLQSRATRANGKPDAQTRTAIEREWLEWGRRGNCEISGKFSWRGLQRHVIETIARDGEAFIRILDQAPNRWGFALQVVDPEAVDIDFSGEYQGREIRMGVEIDGYRRPVAYWLREEPRLNTSSYRNGTRFRVPADEMLHCFLPEFSWQTRGVPWMAVSAARLHMMQATEEAEVTAARASSAKFAGYEANEWAPQPETPVGAGQQLVDASGNPIASSDPGRFSQDVAPGSMEVVPYGYSLKYFDPQHPNAQMPEFLKWNLRSLSTGLGVSYPTLGSDPNGVNYTTLRFFLGVERDHWMEGQDWFQDELPDPIRRRWTDNQIALGTVPYRPGRADQLHAVKWQPRRWEGPDPAKQADADATELTNGTTTLTEIHARKGRDFDDALAERMQELAKIGEAAAAIGLTLQDVMPLLAGKAPAAARPKPSQEDDANA